MRSNVPLSQPSPASRENTREKISYRATLVCITPLHLWTPDRCTLASLQTADVAGLSYLCKGYNGAGIFTRNMVVRSRTRLPLLVPSAAPSSAHGTHSRDLQRQHQPIEYIMRGSQSSVFQQIIFLVLSYIIYPPQTLLRLTL
jgi:hypothetical protein